MIPDKIFIPQHDIEAGTIQELGELIVEGSVGYIREDAMIVFLKQKIEQMKIEAGGFSNMLAAGKYLAYSELIEKIESL